eukprot:TRINITY_DN4511_c0_g1_i2.p1 TRINITY_DN4511_c0_g1~~TRINITY_DN4511_c0_g1_i2.p1  ORF type:complete len:891 (-),score=118.16 TRINITY_DN4511_c0_g1_i2:111-2783(-)
MEPHNSWNTYEYQPTYPPRSYDPNNPFVQPYSQPHYSHNHSNLSHSVNHGQNGSMYNNGGYQGHGVYSIDPSSVYAPPRMAEHPPSNGYAHSSNVGSNFNSNHSYIEQPRGANFNVNYNTGYFPNSHDARNLTRSQSYRGSYTSSEAPVDFTKSIDSRRSTVSYQNNTRNEIQKKEEVNKRRLSLSNPGSRVVRSNSTANIRGKERAQWVPDKTVSKCQICSEVFTFLFRKHHCRRCGRVVCGECSDHQLRLQEYGNTSQRVCQDCFQTIKGTGSQSTNIVGTVSTAISKQLNESTKAFYQMAPEMPSPGLYGTWSTNLDDETLNRLERSVGENLSKDQLIQFVKNFQQFEDPFGGLKKQNLKYVFGILSYVEEEENIYSNWLFRYITNNSVEDPRINFETFLNHMYQTTYGNISMCMSWAYGVLQANSVNSGRPFSLSSLIPFITAVNSWMGNFFPKQRSVYKTANSELSSIMGVNDHFINMDVYTSSPIPWMIVKKLINPNINWNPFDVNIEEEKAKLMRKKIGTPLLPTYPNFHLALNLALGIEISVREGMYASGAQFVFERRLPSIPENPTNVELRKIEMEDSELDTNYTILESAHDHLYYNFKDYAPMLFSRVRHHFGIDDEQYVNSIGFSQIIYNLVFLGRLNTYNQIGSHGKSGSIFFYSFDGKYMIKTISLKEKESLEKMIPQYVEHVTSEKSLLCPLLGLYELQSNDSISPMFVTVMKNIMPDSNFLDELYDLKGSTDGRKTAMKDRKPGVPLKDLDFGDQLIDLGTKKDEVLHIIERDSKFLEECNVMDYSLLLGIKRNKHPIGPSNEHGLYISPNGMNSYYMGVIDFLVPFRTFKKFERTLKSWFKPSMTFSVQPPDLYQSRFVDFLSNKFTDSTSYYR